MKKLLIALLLLVSVPLIFACSKDSKIKSTTAATEAPAVAPTQINVTINGNELTNYSIVYAKSPFNKRMGYASSTEYDFYKLIAKDVAAKIKAVTGVELPVIKDSAGDAGEFEILVGPTNRTESSGLSKLDVYDTCLKVVGSKLVIGGGYNSTPYTGNQKTSYCFASTYHAFDGLFEQLATFLTEGHSAVDLPDGTDLSGKVDLITVACVGDSITEGVGASDMNLYSYPAILQRILWKDHLIVNLGLGGRTMRDDLGTHYRGTTQHSTLRRYATEFDYMLVMLGTNDSYFDRAWPDASDERYLTSADKLVADVTAKNKDVQVVVMNCPVYYGNEGSGSPRVRYLQNQLPARLEKNGVKASFFDMNTYTAKHVGRSNFPDLLHPNDTGYGIMAKGVSEMLVQLEEGSYSYTLPEITGWQKADPPKRSQVADGAENLLGVDLDKLYPMASSPYASWAMDGAPYLFMDLNVFGGYTVTNIEIPVASVKKGDVYTVSVVKYSHPRVTETLKSYTLTATADCSSGWLGFDDLDIVVPEGYTLAFGKPSDSIVPLYLTTPTTGYYFYGSLHNSINTGASLAFNVYGKKS